MSKNWLLIAVTDVLFGVVSFICGVVLIYAVMAVLDNLMASIAVLCFLGACWFIGWVIRTRLVDE